MTAVDTAGVWVVVAAFNEARVIRRVLQELRAAFPAVVVVDDGSIDATAAEARAAGARVVRHPINLGQGAALQTGVQYALRQGASHIATFDADGQHHVVDLARMIDTLRAQRLDIAIGSRFLGRAEGLPAGRRAVLRAAALLTWLTTGVRLSDPHNGLRVMTAAAARRLHILQDQMAHASELVEQIGTLGLRFTEVPVTITYSPYSVEKGQRLANGFRILTDLIVGRLIR
jgi:glycosyltransferase involved in cell wall biosynthesis